MFFSAVNNYCYMISEALNADFRILSQSGWGVMTSRDNNPNANIPDYYEKVCGVLTGEKNEGLGPFKENDFLSWQPDITVVNLGTNDGGGFASPGWKDESTGKVYKQRMDEEGAFHREDLKAFEEAVERFLVKFRSYNKHTHIVWAYGMLGLPMMPSIYRAVDSYVRKTGDKKVSIFQLPNTTVETIGARSHPGKLAHEKAAIELTGYLRRILSN